jgi:hypothetical protein
MLLGTVLIVSKFQNDVFYSNESIASISGVTLADLNLIEEYILDLLDY